MGWRQLPGLDKTHVFECCAGQFDRGLCLSMRSGDSALRTDERLKGLADFDQARLMSRLRRPAASAEPGSLFIPSFRKGIRTGTQRWDNSYCVVSRNHLASRELMDKSAAFAIATYEVFSTELVTDDNYANSASLSLHQKLVSREATGSSTRAMGECW